tara:strand:- start:1450 stop:1980 length:531 start_codon:yes stop_codon:yes gene_type:complete
MNKNIFSMLFWTLIPDRWIIGMACLGRVGFWGKGPGTNGSVAGVLFYMAFLHTAPFWAQLLICAILVAVALPICEQAEIRLRKRDPGEVIIDEFVAQPLVFLGWPVALSGTPWAFAYLLAGFALFRLFDIAKPFGIKRLQSLPGGQGVLVDDLAAAGAAWVVLQVGFQLLFYYSVI